jgi:apolipoprotein N-acyltransferase
LGLSTISLNVFNIAGTPTLAKWEAINTDFGAVSHEHTSALTEFQAVESIQRRALDSNAKVIVFPETVVPAWTAATDAFWDRTLTALRLAGKTIILGAKIIEPSRSPEFSNRDFIESIATLTSQPRRGLAVPTGREVRSPFRNVLIIRGREEGVFEQRVPVPIGMWRPFDRTGAPLHISGAAVLPIAGERAAVLICYEQLLTWPILVSMIQHPTMVLAVANDHWANGTTIPAFQLSAVRAWARLISVPYVSATNY